MKFKLTLFPFFLLINAVVMDSLAQPYWGTIFFDPDIVTSNSSSSFISVTTNGQGLRRMFDRRVNGSVNVNAYLFDATFDDGLTTEIRINPEFGSSEALVQAQKYGPIIGQLPNSLRQNVLGVNIHRGTELFGGGSQAILIHTGQTSEYEADGILEETLIHEAAHTSLDGSHANSEGWLNAQDDDGQFISNYARDNPNREDIAESFLVWVAVRYFPDRISPSDFNSITQTIPNRLAYFDDQNFNLHPLVSNSSIKNSKYKSPPNFVLNQNFPNPVIDITWFKYQLNEPGWISLKIINNSGQEVYTLLEGFQSTGHHQILWDRSISSGESLGAGTYIYQLEKNGKTSLRKFIIAQ